MQRHRVLGNRRRTIKSTVAMKNDPNLGDRFGIGKGTAVYGPTN
jgi:hypothetical protein